MNSSVLVAVEFRVGGLDRQEEPVLARARANDGTLKTG